MSGYWTESGWVDTTPPPPATPIQGSYFDPDLYAWVDANGNRLSKAQLTNAQGQVWVNDPNSNKTVTTGHWATPNGGGGGFLDSVLGSIGNVVNPIGQALSKPVAAVGEAAGPYVPAIIAGTTLAGATGLLGSGAATGAASGGASTAGGLGSMASNVPTAAQWDAMAAAGAPVSAGAASVVPAGLIAAAPQVAGATGLASLPSSVASAADAFGTGAGNVATNAAASAGASGAGAVLPESGLIASAPAAVASSIPVNTTTLAGVDAASTAAGAGAAATYPGLSTGAGIGAAGGAMTLGDITNFLNDNKGLVGAALGALGSGSSSTSTSATKDPWAPAQAWMKANLGLGQDLQKQYQANPFSLYQQQAYNNQAGLANAFRGNVNNLTQQMNAFRPYQRTPQSQVVSPYQFANPNLGFTSKPFGGV